MGGKNQSNPLHVHAHCSRITESAGQVICGLKVCPMFTGMVAVYVQLHTGSSLCLETSEISKERVTACGIGIEGVKAEPPFLCIGTWYCIPSSLAPSACLCLKVISGNFIRLGKNKVNEMRRKEELWWMRGGS